MALGVIGGKEYEHSSVTPELGDTIALYTDGVTETMKGIGEEFEMKWLRAVPALVSSWSPGEINWEIGKVTV